MRTPKQTATHWYRGIFKLKYVFIRERDKESTKKLLVVDRYLRLMVDKTIYHIKV